MRKKNLEVFQAAVSLATSGNFKNWRQVQEALTKKGFDRAPDLLDGEKIRTVLDLLCAKRDDNKAGALVERTSARGPSKPRSA